MFSPNFFLLNLLRKKTYLEIPNLEVNSTEETKEIGDQTVFSVISKTREFASWLLILRQNSSENFCELFFVRKKFKHRAYFS